MLTLIRSYGGWTALALAIVAAFGLYRSEIAAARAQGQAELIAEAADSSYKAVMQDSVSVWGGRIATKDSAYDAVAVELAQQKGATRQAREGALEVVAAARGRIRSLVDSLETLTAEDLATIAAGMDAAEEEAKLCEATLGTCERLVAASDARFFEVEAQLRQTQDVARQGNIALDRLQSLRGPRITPLGYLGWLTAGAATVLMVLR